MKQLNSLLEEVRAKLVSNYQRLNLAGDFFTAEMLKNAYLGKTVEGEEKMTLNRFVTMHNEMLGKTLEPGTMKNYKSTAIYIRNYLNLKYDAGDIYLKDLTHQFITGFEYYVRNNPLKMGDPCTFPKPSEDKGLEELLRLEGRYDNDKLFRVYDVIE